MTAVARPPPPSPALAPFPTDDDEMEAPKTGQRPPKLSHHSGESPVILAPAWRTSKRSGSSQEETKVGENSEKKKEKSYKTMLAAVPRGRPAESDLELLLRELKVDAGVWGVVLRSGVSLAGFLAMEAEEFQMLGIGVSESAWLEEAIVSLHKEPWEPSSLGTLPTMPSSGSAGWKEGETKKAGTGRTGFSCLDLGGQLVNVEQQVQCMRSQLLTAERLVGRCSASELGRLGFQEADNIAVLVAQADKLIDAAAALSAQTRLLRAQLNGGAESSGQAQSSLGLGKAAVSLAIALGLGAALFFSLRRIKP